MRTMLGHLSSLRVVFTLVPWRMRPRLIAILLGSVGVALMDMVAVVLILPVMEIVSGRDIDDSSTLRFLSDLTGIDEARPLLVAILVTVVLLMVAKNALTILFRWWALGIMAEAQSDATHEVMTLYATSPWIHHRRRASEDVYQTLNIDIHASFSGVTTGLISLTVDVIASLALLGALVLVSPLATLVAIVFFGGSALLIQAALKNRILRLAERTRAENLRSWQFLGPSVDGFKEIRLADVGARFASSFSEARRSVARTSRSVTILNELPRYLLEIIMIAGITMIALALLTTSPQDEAFAFLGVFAVAAIRVIPSLNRAVGTLGSIRMSLPNLTALSEEVKRLRSETGRAGGAETPWAFSRSDIRCSDLSFTFPDAGAPVLDGVSATIPAGRTVALVGSSGAGKTTFVELLLALFEPDSGHITVDGVSIHDHPVSWRKQLGVVTQDVYLLDKTIRENIAFGVPSDEIDAQRVAEAVRLAQLTDFVASMPDGLDTNVGYRGARVSGGQKQRIGIARALYRQPQVLVLDEATSALDNETEARITQTVHALHGTMTIVVVAHRLSTVKHADTILFFSQGKIAARGTMTELIDSNVEFAELVRLGRLI